MGRNSRSCMCCLLKKIRTRGCREIANGLDGQRHRQHKSERVWKSILSSSVLPNGCCRNGDWAGARRREAVWSACERDMHSSGCMVQKGTTCLKISHKQENIKSNYIFKSRDLCTLFQENDTAGLMCSLCWLYSFPNIFISFLDFQFVLLVSETTHSIKSWVLTFNLHDRNIVCCLIFSPCSRGMHYLPFTYKTIISQLNIEYVCCSLFIEKTYHV